MKKIMFFLFIIVFSNLTFGQNKKKVDALADKIADEICNCLEEKASAKFLNMDNTYEYCFIRILISHQNEIEELLPSTGSLQDKEINEAQQEDFVWDVIFKVFSMECKFSLDENIDIADDYFDNREYEKAVKHYLIAPEFKLGYLDYNRLGLSYYSLEEHEKAVENYLKALEIAPYNTTVIANMATAYLEMNDTTNALKAIENASRLNTKKNFFYDIAESFPYQEYVKAEVLYKMAIESKPSDTRSYLKLHWIYNYRTLESQKANEILELAHAVDPDNPEILSSLCYAYIESKKCEQALTLLDNFYANNDSLMNGFASWALANCYMEDGHFNEAKIYFLKARDFDRANYYLDLEQLNFNLSKCELNLGNYDAALNLITHQINSDTLNEYFEHRAQIYMAMTDYKAALSDYNFIIRRMPGNCEYYKQRCQCYEKMNMHKEAARDKEIMEILFCDEATIQE